MKCNYLKRLKQSFSPFISGYRQNDINIANVAPHRGAKLSESKDPKLQSKEKNRSIQTPVTESVESVRSLVKILPQRAPIEIPPLVKFQE